MKQPAVFDFKELIYQKNSKKSCTMFKGIMITLQTKCGPVSGSQESGCNVFRGIPYAKAQRFSYAEAVTSWPGTLQALKDGPSC
ncbi:MAG: carboxylesterase family protein, partial [Treponema sp.]|nr:carboxylesterase family protein [Treponema sp.]